MARVLLLALCAAFAASACRSHRATPTEIVVFYATSLTAVLGDLSAEYSRLHPEVRIRLEPSGSQVAARKVSELGMKPDLVALADARLIDKMLVPAHASWNVVFATNEIVLAHKDHSRYTDQIDDRSWPEVLTRPEVRLGRADPDTAPVGYHTLLVWQLAERSGKLGASGVDLSARLLARCAAAHVTHHEAELLALLESRAVDYAFLFRSTAEDHHLKLLALPPEVNLSRVDMADAYATAQVEVRMKQGEGRAMISGGPVTYGVTIPARAPHATAAADFVAFLVSEEGQRAFVRRGFRPVAPAVCSTCAGLPPVLARRVSIPPAGGHE